MNFEEIVGNKRVKEILTSTIESEKILHSYIFLGIEGIGKKLFAENFAKKIMCLDNDDNNCKCSSCIRFENSNNPDFQIITRLPEKKNIVIDQIRQLQLNILEKPIISNRKVYIINDADTMTEQAQNCLLKTLEEPPEYATIILIVSNETKLLATIKSRCSKLFFEKLKDDEVRKIAVNKNLQIDDNILKICDGSIGRVNSILEKIDDYKLIDEILDKIERNDIIDILKESKCLYKMDNLIDLLDYLSIVLFNKKSFKYMNCVNYVEKAKRNLQASANKEMTIDSLVLQIREEINEKNSRS